MISRTPIESGVAEKPTVENPETNRLPSVPAPERVGRTSCRTATVVGRLRPKLRHPDARLSNPPSRPLESPSRRDRLGERVGDEGVQHGLRAARGHP